MKPYLIIILTLCSGNSWALTGDYERIIASYGEPELIAGRGQQQDVNGWLPSMEFTNALQAELSNTHMTQSDAAGNLYLVEKESHAVLKMTPDGRIHTVAGTHQAGNGGDASQWGPEVALSNPNGLYVLPGGTAFILDRDNNKIRRLGTNGWVRTVVTNTLPLLAGRGLWVSPDETTMFYTGTTVVRKWTPAGGVVTYADGFDNLGNMDIDPTDGNLVVTDRGAHRVYRVFPDGSREIIAGDGTTQHHGDGGPATSAGLDKVRGIAFLPHGGYFLATQGDGDIWYVDTDQVAHEFLAGSGSSTPLPHSGICEPRAISLTARGDLIITENDYSVVRVLRRKVVLSEVLQASSSQVGMAWTSMPEQPYTVRFTENLAPADWQQLAEVSGQAADILTTYIATNTAGTATGFYQVEPSP